MVHAIKDSVEVLVHRVSQLGVVVDTFNSVWSHLTLDVLLDLLHRVVKTSLKLLFQNMVGVILQLSFRLLLRIQCRFGLKVGLRAWWLIFCLPSLFGNLDLI